MRLLLALLLVPTLLGAQLSRDSVIAVNTNRLVRLVPDRATLFVTVEGTAETSRDALARADSKLVAVMAALRALGPGIELGTPVAYSVGPTPGARGYPGAPSSPTVTARTAVRVHVARLALLASAFTAAADAGAAGTGALAFESSQSDSARGAEVAAALATARREADAIAAVLGGRIGGIVDISTSSQDRLYQQPAMLPMEGSMGQPTFAPEVTLNIMVNARFRLVR